MVLYHAKEFLCTMGTRDELSERQRGLLLFIEDYVVEYGRPPTNRDIGTGLGIPSTGHVDYHLKALETKGFIHRQQRTSRGIQVLVSLRKNEPRANAALGGIPVMGAIAAGEPLDFYEGQRDVLECVNPTSYKENAFALRVRGNSMIDDGIFDGDFVIVEPGVEAHTRDIIVATNTSAGESSAATLKRFFRDGKRIRLQPANKDFEPIFVEAKDWDRSWTVQGRVAAVVRTYQGN